MVLTSERQGARSRSVRRDGLVVAANVLLNTFCLERAFQALRNQGQMVPEVEKAQNQEGSLLDNAIPEHEGRQQLA